MTTVQRELFARVALAFAVIAGVACSRPGATEQAITCVDTGDGSAFCSTAPDAGVSEDADAGEQCGSGAYDPSSCEIAHQTPPTTTPGSVFPPPDDEPEPDDEPGPTCGDGLCEEGVEDSFNCTSDCPFAYCGNGTCESGEDSSTCSDDCDYPSADDDVYACTDFCGDGVCNAEEDENEATCPTDCNLLAFCAAPPAQPPAFDLDIMLTAYIPNNIRGIVAWMSGGVQHWGFREPAQAWNYHAEADPRGAAQVAVNRPARQYHRVEIAIPRARNLTAGHTFNAHCGASHRWVRQRNGTFRLLPGMRGTRTATPSKTDAAVGQWVGRGMQQRETWILAQSQGTYPFRFGPDIDMETWGYVRTLADGSARVWLRVLTNQFPSYDGAYNEPTAGWTQFHNRPTARPAANFWGLAFAFHRDYYLFTINAARTQVTHQAITARQFTRRVENP